MRRESKRFPTRMRGLRLLRLEKAEKRSVLGEERLDLSHSRTGPILEPGLAEVVLDLVQTALAHGRKYRHRPRMAPWAEWLIRGSRSPIVSPTLGRLSADQPALRQGFSKRGRACR